MSSLITGGIHIPLACDWQKVVDYS